MHFTLTVAVYPVVVVGLSTLLVAIGGVVIYTALLRLNALLTVKVDAPTAVYLNVVMALVLICSPKIRKSEGFLRDCSYILAV